MPTFLASISLRAWLVGGLIAALLGWHYLAVWRAGEEGEMKGATEYSAKYEEANQRAHDEHQKVIDLQAASVTNIQIAAKLDAVKKQFSMIGNIPKPGKSVGKECDADDPRRDWANSTRE